MNEFDDEQFNIDDYQQILVDSQQTEKQFHFQVIDGRKQRIIISPLDE